MGVDAAGLRFLLDAARGGTDFARVLTIGRQELFLAPAEMERALGDYGRAVPAGLSAEGYAEPLFAALGAESVESLDASSYEGATLVADLNRGVDAALHGRFTLVFDGGSLEHVFDYPRAIRACMQMVAPGGRLISITPADAMCGHGFYQLSPELFYRLFTPENGFEVETLLLGDDRGRWWRVADPALLGRRVELNARRPSLLFLRARRIDDREPLVRPPQQSDYAALWEGRGPAGAPAEPRLARLRRRLRGDGGIDPEAFQPTSL